jgi:hypothetical protein
MIGPFDKCLVCGSKAEFLEAACPKYLTGEHATLDEKGPGWPLCCACDDALTGIHERRKKSQLGPLPLPELK